MSRWHAAVGVRGLNSYGLCSMNVIVDDGVCDWLDGGLLTRAVRLSPVSPARPSVPSTWTTSRRCSTGSSKSRGPATPPGLPYPTSKSPDRGED